MKADRIRAIDKEDWTAVASIDRTRLKHIEMGSKVIPLSISEKDKRWLMLTYNLN